MIRYPSLHDQWTGQDRQVLQELWELLRTKLVESATHGGIVPPLDDIALVSEGDLCVEVFCIQLSESVARSSAVDRGWPRTMFPALSKFNSLDPFIDSSS